jgi:hypothetical protein
MLRLSFPRTIEFPPAKREYQVNDYLTFSSQWPTNVGIAPNHTYQVVWREDVPYDIWNIIQAGDYKDVNISDNTQNVATDPAYENLYPYGSQNTIYQILIGLKPGNYMLHLYMPYDQYILGLEFTNMVPNDQNMTDPRLKYIGSIKPEDSPYYDPRLTLVTVYNMVPFYLRFLVDTGDDEKCIAPVIINHCQLNDLTPPATGATPAQTAAYNQAVAKAQMIRYIAEINFRNPYRGGS